MGGTVNSAVRRSAQAVDLRRGLVGNPVGCLVRCLRYIFNLGARWIRSTTRPGPNAPCWRVSIHINSFRKNYAAGYAVDTAVAFAVALSVFELRATIRRSLISSWDSFRSVERERHICQSGSGSRVARASPFGLAKVKALAHLRHDIPPTRIGQATAYALDMSVPVTASRVGVLSPQHDVKIFEDSIFGNFLFDSQVEGNNVDQRTCHECSDDLLMQEARMYERYRFWRAFGISAGESARKPRAYVACGQVNLLLPDRRLRGQP